CIRPTLVTWPQPPVLCSGIGTYGGIDHQVRCRKGGFAGLWRSRSGRSTTGFRLLMKGSYMPSSKTTRRAVRVPVAAATCFAFTLNPGTASRSDLPDGPALARNLVRKVTVGNINRHLIALQRFADQTDGTRAAGTEGHRRSAEYIANKLETAGFIVD